MSLRRLSVREQWLVVATVAVVLCGGYGLLRYPALKALQDTQARTQATEKRLQALVYPDEPAQDEADLQEALEDAEGLLEGVRLRQATLEWRLAPTDAAEVRLKISDLARLYGVRIRENEAYQLPAALLPPVAAARTPRNAKRKAKAPAAAATPAPPIPVTDLDRPPIEMLERFGLVAELRRPLQRLSMEASFHALRAFVAALDKLPWQVTVAQLQIESDERTPPFGVPQPLRATVILAL